jgi:alpha-mannosidase
MKYAIYPHKGSFLESDVVQTGYQFNVSPIIQKILVEDSQLLIQSNHSLFTVDKPNLVIDSIKFAEDARDGKFDVIVRLYESMGGRGTALLKS